MNVVQSSLLEGLFAFFSVCFYAYVCFACGSLLLWRVRAVTKPQLDIATRFLLGQGVLASLWMLIGLAGVFTLPVVLSISGALLLLYWYLSRSSERTSFRDYISQHTQDFGVFTWLLVAVFCTFGIFNILLPMRLNAGDAFFYYMITPKVLALSGELFPPMGREWTSHRGLIGEMSYAAAFLFAGQRASTLLAWLTAGTVFVYFRRLGRQLQLRLTAKDLMWAMLLSSSGFYLFFSDGKVEMFGTSYAVAGFWWALQAKHRKYGYTPVVLCAAFAAFTFIAKLSYPLVTLSIWLLLFWNLTVAYTGWYWVRKTAISGVLLGLVSIICLIPHAIKNDYWYDLPLAPYPVLTRFPAFLPDDWVNPQLQLRQQQWEEWQGEDDENPEIVSAVDRERAKVFSPDFSNTQIFLNWWRFLIYNMVRFQVGRLSPLMLGAVPALLLISARQWRKHIDLLRLATSALVGLGLYVYLFPPQVGVRTMLPSFLVLIPALAFGLDKLFDRIPFRLGGVALQAVMLIGIVGYGAFDKELARVQNVYTQADLCQFDERAVAECEAFEFINATLPEGARLLHAGYDFWLREDLLMCLASNPEWTTFNDGWEKMYGHGFEYFIEKQIANRYGTYPRPDWLTPTIIFENDAYRVIKLESERTVTPTTYCQQTAQTWHIAVTE